MKLPSGRTLAKWLLVVPVLLGGLFVAYIAFMFSLFFDRGIVQAAEPFHISPQIALALGNLISVIVALLIWTVPTTLAVGFAMSADMRKPFLWGITVALLLATPYVWIMTLAGTNLAPHVFAVAAGATVVAGAVISALMGRFRIHAIAAICAFILMTVPCWIALANSPKEAAAARPVWSSMLQKGTWQAMNTGSSFASTRQVVFAGDRLVAVFESGSSGYEGKSPMSIYRLVSIDRKTGSILKKLEFKGRWAGMPYLFATRDGHVVISNASSLTLLNPDLTDSGPKFEIPRGRAIEMSPDGTVLAWETTPGTTIIDAATLKPTIVKFSESVPTSVSERGVLTDNVYWYRDYPKDKAFVTFTDEHGQRLLFHGDCGGRPKFLTSIRVLVVGCGKVRLLDLSGNIVREQRVDGGPATIASIAQDGKRFALQFSVLLICLMTFAQQGQVRLDPKTRLQPANGRVVNGRYLNESLGFSYLLPDSGWFVNEDLASRPLPDGSILLLVADRHTGRPLRNRLLLIADDQNRYSNPLDARQYVSKIVHAQTNKEGIELVHDVFPVDFASRHFFRADYRETGDAGSISKAFIATEFRGFFLSWTFVAGSQNELDHLVDSLRQISFRKDPNQPPTEEPVSATANQPKAPGENASAAGTQQHATDRPLRVRVSHGVSQAFLLKKVQPTYPDEARKNHIQGTVVMKALISQTGDVKELTLISGDPSLAPSALDAVKQWKYKPYYLQGRAVEVETQVTVAFQLTGH